MRRAAFTAGLLAAAAHPAFASGSRTTIDALLADLPAVRSHTWVQYVLGSGVRYLKKIGYGVERTSLGALPFIETQIGSDETTCNPNTIRKGYLRGQRYGDLLQPHDVSRYVMKSGTTFLLVEASAADTLWLLDQDDLYSHGTARIVEERKETVTMRNRRFSTRRVKLAFARGSARDLRTMTLWLTPAVPNGIAKLHATLASADPFELRIDSFGENYLSLVTESFDALRAKG
jgi:hypothetical protein